MDSVSQIKQNLDIIDVIGTYVSLKKSGHNYKGVCPFHNEKTPSFMVSPELQIYKCFGCGASGDMFKFVQEIEGIDFSDALEQLAERAGVTLEKRDFDPQGKAKKIIYEINEETTKFYQYLLLKHEVGKKGLEYVEKKRKLTKETIKEFRIGYAPNSWETLYNYLKKKGFSDEDLAQSGVVTQRYSGDGLRDKFVGRVVFPLSGVDKKIVGFTGRTIFDKDPKYLNTSETPVFHKTYFLYGLDKAKLAIKHEGAVFVEGQMDVISAHQAGIHNVIATSGTSLTEQQLHLLSRFTKDITFCFDSDSAGINAIHRAVGLAEKYDFNSRVCLIPKEFKDLDELILADPERAKELLKSPISVYDFFVSKALELHDKKSALGKKEILRVLRSPLTQISDKAVYEHYAKLLSRELDLSMETILESLSSTDSSSESKIKDNKDERKMEPILSVTNSESYFYAILLKNDLDTFLEYLYKLDLGDFLTPELSQITETLQKTFKNAGQSLDIKSLIVNLDDTLGKLLTDLFMWDLGETVNLEDTEKLQSELERAMHRVKRDSAKRQLKQLSEDIRIAEMANDITQVNELTKKFEELSKNLL